MKAVFEPKGSTVYHSWLMVAACFTLTLTLGETFWTFGIFFKPLEHEFGWNRAVISSIFTAFLLGYAVSAIASGKLADRYRPRPILLISALLIGVGLCLCSLASNIHHFHLFLFTVGLGSGATWSVPNATVQRWFYGKKNAGLALGIVVSGVGVGAMVFAPLINYWISTSGWRNTFLIIGVLFFSIMVTASLVIRPSPPDTMGKVHDDHPEAVPNDVALRAPKRLLLTWAFAAMAFMVSAGVFAFQIISAHIVPHATDVGISPSASAAALGLMGGFSVPGRIASGLLASRWGWRKLLSIAFFGMGASIVWLLILKDVRMLYAFVFFYGVFHGIRISGQVGVLAEIFGVRSLGELIGVSSALAMAVGAFAPYIAGVVFDTKGTYAPVFLIVIVLLVAAGLVAAMLKRVPNRDIPGPFKR
ncbi:MAG: MFS transporter [Pseudomonadota bacterium]